MQSLYQEIILDHYKHPHHAGLRDPFDAEVHHVNTSCGDEITLRLELRGDGPEATVTDISYDAVGCSISQASTSVMTDLLIGSTVAQSLDILDTFNEMVSSRGTVEGDPEVLDDAVAFQGVSQFPARVKCALLGWFAFKDAAGRAVALQG
jgi:nitrogen fixation protein NifU and related proteins